MDYYKEKQFIAYIDKNDKILGKIEKWEAHKKGTLHRGFTAILTYENQYLVQHRKHPVFDKVYDFSFSSHQIFPPLLSSRATLSDPELVEGESKGSRGIYLQSNEEAIYTGLKREWNIEKKDIKSEPKFLKKFYYKAKDPNSDFTEHEIDYIYKVELKKLPSPNLDFAYGSKLIDKKEILNSEFLILNSNVAPWVKIMIEEKIIK
ncbi:hypothetical protein A2866_04585 [Candidatus Roizmanbacteria bacterium RIFCSPHIGHO2_01_FULL_39_8]|uniref:Nudix hydrolase domain-containing protein n=3 Tax=Candidatus Roizmaniibacteriota TaxID=1752723 RepID=A0A1F7GSJ3_9BACT|nr:MAG: hypothetical protein A2866_04585 [Candidatus Roizmanbacteria bacterium RIFCSPHIGHO2_01_FULL_39_8]OGK28002.1 MAG: hypothetical protein A3C28_02735 [Candidatus Roizmanbacteria bacterium RIFCSPHIGHO2_02_FULL_39_9]OGK35712.1 MAG: hypothetical protein A3F60_00900 [Candidatus Roizmanbacteria bacterium RIFCSPHIGHO2_12_FULL_39_8]